MKKPTDINCVSCSAYEQVCPFLSVANPVDIKRIAEFNFADIANDPDENEWYCSLLGFVVPYEHNGILCVDEDWKWVDDDILKKQQKFVNESNDMNSCFAEIHRRHWVLKQRLGNTKK